MRWQDNFIGALTFRTATFIALRERSDVFQRGFQVLLVAALVVGLFTSLSGAIRRVTPLTTETQVLAEARQSFENSYNGPPEIGAQIEPYITEIAGMIYDLINLPPRGGAAFRPVAAVLSYIGGVISTPFSLQFAGWLLLSGLLFHFSSRLLGGRASMSQMLGLTSLAAAPQIFSALTNLLMLIQTTSGIAVLGGLASLLGFLISIWSAAVYFQATAVAQNFSYARTLAAIVLGYVILIGAMFLILLLVIFAAALFILPIARQAQ